MDQESIVKFIKDAIIRNKFKPGERIVELQLAKELGINRSRIREAVKQLVHEGFLEYIPNKGTAVKKISQKDIAQLWDIMGTLEGLSVRIATPVMPEEQITEIERLVLAMEKNQEDKFLLSRYNFEFHNYLTEISGNEHLIEYMQNIREKTNRTRLQTFYSEEQVRASHREHRAVLNAIRARKANRAENLIRKHYLDSKDRLIKFYFHSL